MITHELVILFDSLHGHKQGLDHRVGDGHICDRITDLISTGTKLSERHSDTTLIHVNILEQRIVSPLPP